MRILPTTLSRTCAGLLVTTSLLAQGSITSPLGTDTVEGSGYNDFPFNSSVTRRYMQIHGDLGSVPRVITGMSFRVDASTTNFTGTRDQDIEVYMGHGVPDAQLLPRFTFDANYASPKVLVLPRTIVTHGPTGQAVMPGPNPFTVDVVFATPFTYLGNAPLIWEVAVFGSVLNGTFSYLDAVDSTQANATSTVTGAGCAPAGSTAPMTHAYTITDSGGTLLMNGTIAGAPPNALALMAIGFANPNLAVPGLCSGLYTDATIVQVLGQTSATGAYSGNTPTGAFVLPNTGAGIALFTQAFVFDQQSTSGLPLTASDGRTATIPSTLPTPIPQVTRLWNNVGGTSAPMAAFFTGSTVGYGLVTRFNHL